MNTYTVFSNHRAPLVPILNHVCTSLRPTIQRTHALSYPTTHTHTDTHTLSLSLSLPHIRQYNFLSLSLSLSLSFFTSFISAMGRSCCFLSTVVLDVFCTVTLFYSECTIVSLHNIMVYNYILHIKKVSFHSLSIVFHGIGML